MLSHVSACKWQSGKKNRQFNGQKKYELYAYVNKQDVLNISVSVIISG